MNLCEGRLPVDARGHPSRTFRDGGEGGVRTRTRAGLLARDVDEQLK